MKFTVLQDNFSKALNIVSRFSGGKVQLPVLANIHIVAKGAKVILSATNLEMSAVVPVGAKVEEEGDITIPARIITELVSSLDKVQLEITAKEEKMVIKTQNSKNMILGMNSSDFPSIPQKIDENCYSVESQKLKNALSYVLFAVSNDETRPVLTGVLVIMRKNELIFVATDGFRLSQYRLAVDDTKIEDETKFIVPKAILHEVIKIAEGKEIKFSFNKKENQIVFSIDGLILTSRIIQGEFPDFERIIPKDSKYTFRADREVLFKNIKMASVFARDSGNIIKISLLKDELELSAESSQSGNHTATSEVKYEQKEKDDLVIAYNYKFLEEFLASSKEDEIVVKLSDSNSPGLFLDPKEANYLHIIMPVRIS
jgi:DNA polymerase-3 subunit beta